jgi:hypothetical protein
VFEIWVFGCLGVSRVCVGVSWVFGRASLGALFGGPLGYLVVYLGGSQQYIGSQFGKGGQTPPSVAFGTKAPNWHYWRRAPLSP